MMRAFKLQTINSKQYDLKYMGSKSVGVDHLVSIRLLKTVVLSHVLQGIH